MYIYQLHINVEEMMVCAYGNWYLEEILLTT